MKRIILILSCLILSVFLLPCVVVNAANNASVLLEDSQGNPLAGGTVQYYNNGWQTLGTTDSSGKVSCNIPSSTFTFAMNYAGGQQQLTQNIASNPTVVFQTALATVQLKDHTGNPLDTGSVQYYASGWKTFGSGATSGGQVTMELLPLNYTFAMNYAGGQQHLTQNISTNPTVVFQTTLTTVQLKDHTGNPLDTGSVQYYASGWKTFGIGNTSGGQVTMELLPLNYTFAMNYAGGQQQLTQNIASNPTVVFQTALATVQLKDHTGNPLDTGSVQYYASGWKTFGIGNTSGGQVSMELLPLNYTFAMNYAGGQQQLTQNISSNPIVLFQTTLATVQLKDHAGNPMDTGTVQYYASGWKTFGSGATSGGQVTMELLPLNYTFAMNYAGGQQQLTQNISTNPTVVFQTTLTTVQLKDHTGNPLDTGSVQYYASGWKTFGIGNTSGGQVTMELLPLNYTFAMSYAGGQQQLTQNIASNPTVVFQTALATVQLKDHAGNLTDRGTVQYYASGWKTFGSGATSGGQVTMELLPLNYTFAMTYAGKQQQLTQNIAADPTVVFSLETPTQAWHLDSSGPPNMEKDGIQKGSVTVNGTTTWLSNGQANTSVAFEAGTWIVYLNTTNLTGNYTVQIGYSDSNGNFTTFDSGSASGVANGTPITVSVPLNGVTVPKDDYLALRVTNNSKGSVITDGSSYLASPLSDPSYPLPELTTGMLLGMGLAGIGLYLALKKRKSGVKISI